MMAAGLKMPELAIGMPEAQRLAKASIEVAKNYNVMLSAKTVAWIQLGIVATGIYVPRAFALGGRLKHAQHTPPTKTDLTPSPESAVVN